MFSVFFARINVRFV